MKIAGFRESVPLLLLGGLLIAYAWLLLAYQVPVTGGTDQNGYHVAARLFNQNGVFYQVPPDPLAFVGHMWVANERGEFFAKYPPLYPLLAAGMNQLLGPGGGFYATVWGALLAVAGMYALGRFFLGRYWALAAALLLALSPVVTALALSHNSHTPSLALFLWGLTLTVQASRRRSFGGFAALFFGGILVGWTVGVRYTDALLLLVPAAWLILFTHGKYRWFALFALGAGAALPWGMMALYHWISFGAPWRSGYSLTDESSAFTIRFVWDNLKIYVPEFFLLSVGPMGIAMFFFRKINWRRSLFWCIWLLPTFFLYLTYYWAPDGENTGAQRFLVPLIPAVLILALRAWKRILRPVNPAWLGRVTLCLLLAVQFFWGWSRIGRLCEGIHNRNLQYLVLVEALRSRIPVGSVIVSSDGILNELGFEQRWNLYPGYLFARWELDRVISRSLEAQAAGLQKSRALFLREKFGKFSNWQLQQYFIKFLENQQKAGRDVYFIERGGTINRFRQMFYRTFELEELGKITGERPPWVLIRQKRNASRYWEENQKPPMEPLAVYELVKLGARREKPLSSIASEALLQTERQQLRDELNPDKDPLVLRNLDRLETLRDNISSLRRSIQAEKERREKIRKQQELQKLKQKQKLKKPNTSASGKDVQKK